MKAFMKNADDTLKELGVDKERGLTDAQVEESRKKYGENMFTQEKPESFLKKVIDSFKEPMIIMLLFAAVITLGVNIARQLTGGETDYFECVGIFAAILLSVVITVVMEGRSAKAFEMLRKFGQDTPSRVIRNGAAEMVAQKDIVVGDIVCIETGDKLPADCRLIESTSLLTDESALTGESMPVQKDAELVFDNEKTPVAERANLLYSGCFVVGGSGKAVVTDIGDNTEFGKIARELSSTEKQSTPLQEKMASLGKKIAILGVIAAAIVFVVEMFQLISTGDVSFVTVSEAFITSIVLIVAAVPEGMPTIVAISLAINIIKMSKQNALVKKMVACETIGCINVICSDKTGTLTENRMTVTDVYINSQMAICPPDQLKDEYLVNNFCVNSTADVHMDGDQMKYIGNPTECALLTSIYKSGMDYEKVRNETNILHVFPFSSETKNMTTITDNGHGATVYTKGSPEKILAMCNISEQNQKDVEERIIAYQSKACRVIGFAHKETEYLSDYESAREDLESGLIFDGFVAITDPLRQDVYEAVNKCRSAGIDLKILTGDNIVTAEAIANELGILDADHISVEAHEIEELSDEELRAKIPQIRVIARSTPSVKMRVVRALKANGNVVAVTGDGINDAPAIKNADVGIAMGITGTEVSKEASDIVLLDDSFSTIVKAVQWGRGIYENFQRFIQFQLTVNVSSVLVILTSILSGLAAPFTALELLWVNIIMDGPPALTLGLEPIRDHLMKKKPTERNAAIVNKGMLSRIAINGVFIAIVIMLQYAFNFLGGSSEEECSTILFTLFVVFQLFNALNSREISNESIFKYLLNNKLMLGVFALTFLLQVIITQFGGMFFGTVPLSLMMWAKIIGVGLCVIVLSELVKLVKRIVARVRA